MQVGDLVKYVGCARLYKGRVGVVAGIFARHGDMTIQVHYAGIEGEGRDAPGLGQIHDGLHPMAREELEVINASR